VYDATGSYEVGFITLICASFAAFSLMVAIYVIDRVAKTEATGKNSTTDDLKSQSSA